MKNLKQDLELLYELQAYDIEIDNIKKEIEQVPLLMEEKQNVLSTKKAEADAMKQNFVKMNSLRKEKESLLDSKEKMISKYVLELNTVKSNDTYKSLLLEIDKSKADKNIVEDEILGLMDKIDKEFVLIKASEDELKATENKIENDICEIRKSMEKLEASMVEIEKKREEYKSKIEKSILLHYERLREGCDDGQGIAIVDENSCGGCGMVLRPQLVNQAQKLCDLTFCDNCSRILLKR